jgi:RNA-directed DNA polymerase
VTRHARKGQPHPFEPARPLQRKLYQAAKRSRQRRFHALYDRIVRPDLLGRAWREVRANGGSAGIDAVQRDDVARQGVTPLLQALEQDLRAGSDRPQPGRRVSIPKPDGRQRPRGMPTVRDRVGPQACKIVIEPLVEASFQDTADGVRPKRSATQAVKVVKEQRLAHGAVVEVDIEGFFDPRDHARLMRLVARRISDRRVVKRLRQWLTVGVVEAGQGHPTTRGAPQGGVLSPVLANIDLPVLDLYWTQQDRALGHLTRDADDMRLVCRTRGAAEQALQAVTPVLQQRKLTVHPTKTRIVDVKRAGCELLGFHLHQGSARPSGKLIPLRWPGQTAMQAIRRHMREQTERRGLRGTLTALVAKLNPSIRGWRNYFRVGHSTKKFQDLDRSVRQRVGQWERARLQRAATAGQLQALRRTSGLESFSARGRCGPRP